MLYFYPRIGFLSAMVVFALLFIGLGGIELLFMKLEKA